MTERLVIAFFLLLWSAPLMGAGLETPTLSPPINMRGFLEPERLVTTGGIRYPATSHLVLEPEWGLGYYVRGQGKPGGGEEDLHQLHAQAGWRLSMADTLYLSAAAKVPVYTLGRSGSFYGQERGIRQEYDLIHPFRSAPRWVGEVGVHLTRRTDFSLYYDQGVISGWLSPGRQDERIGTRFIWRFW